MNTFNDTATRPTLQDGVIELGIASIVTMGGGIPGGEELGENPMPGISEK